VYEALSYQKDVLQESLQGASFPMGILVGKDWNLLQTLLLACKPWPTFFKHLKMASIVSSLRRCCNDGLKLLESEGFNNGLKLLEWACNRCNLRLS
jgi:hypothetical protein